MRTIWGGLVNENCRSMEGVAKPHFPVGTILAGRYSIGYWSRCKYFRVVGHTKVGAPRVVELGKTITYEMSTPADSEVRHILAEPVVVVGGGSTFSARWSNKDGHWGISLGDLDGRATLEPHVPGTVFSETSYG